MPQNQTSGHAWYSRANINHDARRRKSQQHRANLLNRAETNRLRSNSPLTNPNYHGMGYHALGKVRKQKKS